MSFRPAKSGQFEPVTPTSPKDCVAATTAQLINRATVDTIRTNHAVIRKRSGAPGTRGLYLAEAIAAAKSFGVTLTPYYGLSRNETRDLVAAGHAVGFLIDCSVTRYTTRRTNFYTGPHMVYGNSYSWWPAGEKCACEKRTATAHGEYSIDDPGTTSVGYLQWSADLVYRAAESYANGSGIYLLAAPDTEGRSWKAVSASAIRSLPSYSKGVTLATMKLGQVFPGGRTDNGGDWRRGDGQMANGWAHLQQPNGKYGWSKGESLVMA